MVHEGEIKEARAKNFFLKKEAGKEKLCKMKSCVKHCYKNGLVPARTHVGLLTLELFCFCLNRLASHMYQVLASSLAFAKLITIYILSLDVENSWIVLFLDFPGHKYHRIAFTYWPPWHIAKGQDRIARILSCRTQWILP